MANAARVHAIERGKEPSEYTMIAFGGGAPLHAARLAEKLGIARVIVPVNAGVGSAVGFLRAPVAYQVVKSYRSGLDPDEIGMLAGLMAEMAAEAEAVVRQGAGAAPVTLSASADLRYRGQGHELTVPLASHNLAASDLAGLRTAFEELYERVYGLTMPFAPVESVSWSVNATTEPDASPAIVPVDRIEPAASNGTRPAYDAATGAMADHRLFWRAGLAPGDQIDGPAIIAEDETSTIVPLNFSARVETGGALIIDRRAGGGEVSE